MADDADYGDEAGEGEYEEGHYRDVGNGWWETKDENGDIYYYHEVCCWRVGAGQPRAQLRPAATPVVAAPRSPAATFCGAWPADAWRLTMPPVPVTSGAQR